jgi:hypothetical protein
MFFHAAGPERFMFCNYGAAGNQFSAIQGTPADGIATTGGGDLQGPIDDKRWYDISLIVTKNSAEMLLEGKRVSRVEASALPAFFATAGYRRTDGTVVVKATNYHAEPVRVEVRLDGTTQVGATGQHLVIRADKPEDENTLDKPDLITPQVLPLTGCSQDFQVTLPPYSVNILRIPAKAADTIGCAGSRPLDTQVGSCDHCGSLPSTVGRGQCECGVCDEQPKRVPSICVPDCRDLLCRKCGVGCGTEWLSTSRLLPTRGLAVQASFRGPKLVARGLLGHVSAAGPARFRSGDELADV